MSASAATLAGTAAGSALLLRVLAGGNAGAQIRLETGEWVVGSGPDADLFFAEPALADAHLRLLVGAAQVRLTALAPGVTMGNEALAPSTPRDLPFLVPVGIGATVFAIGTDGSDWAAARAVSAPPNDPVAVPPPEPDAVAASVTVPAGVAVTTEALHPVARAEPRRRRPVLATLLVLSLVLLAIGVWAAARVLAPVPTADAPRTSRAAEARGIVQQLGLANQVRVEGRGERLTLTGQVRTAEQRQQLQDRLREAGVQADFAVLTDASLLDLAGTVIKAYGLDAKAAVTGPGQIALSGYAPDAAKVEAVIRRLREDLPGLQMVQDTVTTPDRARTAIEQALRTAGLSGVLRVSGTGNRIVVSGNASPAAVQTWTEMAEQMRPRLGDHIRLDTQVTQSAIAAPRGVRLGRNGYVLLEDGRRLAVGDTFEPLGRVLALDEKRLRLQTATGPVDLPYSKAPNWIMEEKDGVR